MNNNIKRILQQDYAMWIGAVAIILLLSGVIFILKREERQVDAQAGLIITQIREDEKRILKDNPDFIIPKTSYGMYISDSEDPKLADKIAIKNYYLNDQYTKATYILRNNYECDIFITPEVVKPVNHENSSTEVLLYDFNQAYKIIHPNEEVNLEVIIPKTSREFINRKKFNLYRMIHKADPSRTIIGYIKIGDGNE